MRPKRYSLQIDIINYFSIFLIWLELRLFNRRCLVGIQSVPPIIFVDRIVAIAVGKYPQSPSQSPNKRPIRKKRVNIILYNPYKVPTASRVTVKAPLGVDISITPASKTPRLRLNIISYRVLATPLLIFYRPKSHIKRRSKLVINVSSSPLTELSNNSNNSFNSVLQPDPKDTQALIVYRKNPRLSFAQILARRSLSLIERSNSLYLYRSSQSNSVPRYPALPDTPPNS